MASYPDRTIQSDLLLDLLDQSPFLSLTLMDVLHTIDSQPALPPTSSFSPSSLATVITSSSDRLFFLYTTPPPAEFGLDGTLFVLTGP
jgi:hypothetical protein